jgi:RimJ/RimL family protein N-acetyltransferase
VDLTIRKAAPEDAEQMIFHLVQLSNEPNICIPLSPGEFNKTVEEEATIIIETNNSDNSVFMIAFDNDKLVGVSNAFGGKHNATRHCADVGISINKDYRGMGIGKKLMKYLIDWAKETSILTRLELCVYERNTLAIKLYEDLGFVIQGKKEKAIFQNGNYENEIIMALLI